MNGKQMVEAVHEHFPQKGGLRVLQDLNAELRRYAEDVRAFRGDISFFEQELCTENGEPIVTHASASLLVEQYGSSFPLPTECFIVRAKRVAGPMYVDVNARKVTLFADHLQHTLLALTQDNRDAYTLTLDCILYPAPLQFDDEQRIDSHGDAIVAGVLASYCGATGNFQQSGWWKKEAKEARRKAKEHSTTDGSYSVHTQSLLTPSKDRR